VILPQNLRVNWPGQSWVDPRGPDGVTILASYEQPQPIEYPGLRTGDEPRAMSLFDLENDPEEQHDAAAQHGDVVARLKARYDQIVTDYPAVAQGWSEVTMPDLVSRLVECERD
jgi:hypothetical protein